MFQVCHLDPVLRQFSAVHIFTPYVSKMRSPTGLFPLSCETKILNVFLVSPILFMLDILPASAFFI
jgi:hypothetical protein